MQTPSQAPLPDPDTLTPGPCRPETAPPPPTAPDFPERHDHPDEAEELERQQDA